MKALALVLVAALSLPAWAQDAQPELSADAPIILPAGEAAPVDGVLLPNDVAVAAAKRLKACEAKVVVHEVAPAPLHPAIIVGLIVAGVIAGGAAGYGIAKAVQ